MRVGEPRVDAFDIAASGLRAQRMRMEVIANNLANKDVTSAQTVVDDDGTVRHLPYRRRQVFFAPGIHERGELQRGVTVMGVGEDMTDFEDAGYRPDHPHSVRAPGSPLDGHLLMPNVNEIIEMTDMISATRAYQANLTSIELLKSMSDSSLRILA